MITSMLPEATLSLCHVLQTELYNLVHFNDIILHNYSICGCHFGVQPPHRNVLGDTNDLFLNDRVLNSALLLPCQRWLSTSQVVHSSSLSTYSVYKASVASYRGTLAFTTNSVLYTKMAAVHQFCKCDIT